MTARLCLNCDQRARNGCGGLCRRCYSFPDIRALYPPLGRSSSYARRVRENGAYAAYRQARDRGLLLVGCCPHGKKDGECPVCERALRAALPVPEEEASPDD